MDNVSQSKKILAYLKTHNKGITPMDALRKFECFRLAARIADLRADGHDIRSEMETIEYEDGSKKRYARYFLHG